MGWKHEVELRVGVELAYKEFSEKNRC